MSNFKLIFLGIFVAAAVFGVLAFGGIIDFGGTKGATEVTGTVVVWGTLPSQPMVRYFSELRRQSQDIQFTYVQKNPATFASELVESIASNAAPDLVIMPDNFLFRFRNKITHIPYASLPQRTLQDTFITGSSLFAVSDGSLAIPWAADPLVLYYNRDLLEAGGIAKVPATWEAFTETVPILTKKTSDLTLTQSAAALGTFKNIAHAKDLIALVFMTGGNEFISPGSTRLLDIHFGSGAVQSDNTRAVEAMTFYTAFADPVKEVYTWNAGEILDRDAFIRASLVYYFGYASELPSIRAQNPNLNFDVALPPQSATTIPVSTGRMYGLSIPTAAKNQLLSYTAATLLASAPAQQLLAEEMITTLALMPVRRDIIAQKPANDRYLTLLYNVTLVLRPWLDPDPAITDTIFAKLVSDIISGILSVGQSLDSASAQISTQSSRI